VAFADWETVAGATSRKIMYLEIPADKTDFPPLFSTPFFLYTYTLLFATSLCFPTREKPKIKKEEWVIYCNYLFYFVI